MHVGPYSCSMDQAKMEEVAAPKADGATPRLMITKMVLENFKSYGGVREVKKRAPRSAHALFHDRGCIRRGAPRRLAHFTSGSRPLSARTARGSPT